MNKLSAVLGIVFAVAIVGGRYLRARPRPVAVTAPAPVRSPVVPRRQPAPPSQGPMTEHGLGPVQLGATREAVERALGEPFRVGPTGNGPCGVAEWPSGPKGVRVFVGRGIVRRIDIEAPGITTDEGIAIGADSTAIVNRYAPLVGKEIRKSSRSDVIIVKLTSGDSAAAFAFLLTSDRKMFAYQLGYDREIDNHNVCV